MIKVAKPERYDFTRLESRLGSNYYHDRGDHGENGITECLETLSCEQVFHWHRVPLSSAAKAMLNTCIKEVPLVTKTRLIKLIIKILNMASLPKHPRYLCE